MGPLKTKRKFGGWQAFIDESVKRRIAELERQAAEAAARIEKLESQQAAGSTLGAKGGGDASS